MTGPETKQFVLYLLQQLPGTNNWLRYNSPDPIATLTGWQRVFKRVPYKAAVAAVDGMLDCRYEMLEPYHRERTPSHICRLGRQIASAQQQEREAQQRRAEYQLSVQRRRFNHEGSMQ